jgi:hypothetical protein
MQALAQSSPPSPPSPIRLTGIFVGAEVQTAPDIELERSGTQLGTRDAVSCATTRCLYTQEKKQVTDLESMIGCEGPKSNFVRKPHNQAYLICQDTLVVIISRDTGTTQTCPTYAIKDHEGSHEISKLAAKRCIKGLGHSPRSQSPSTNTFRYNSIS